MRFQVELGNATGQPVAFDPCPAYLMEFAVMGDGTATLPGVSTSRMYRLNCRPVSSVPAGAEVRFEMYTQVPAGLATGRVLMVSWRLISPKLTTPMHYGVLRLRVG